MSRAARGRMPTKPGHTPQGPANMGAVCPESGVGSQTRGRVPPERAREAARAPADHVCRADAGARARACGRRRRARKQGRRKAGSRPGQRGVRIGAVTWATEWGPDPSAPDQTSASKTVETRGVAQSTGSGRSEEAERRRVMRDRHDAAHMYICSPGGPTGAFEPPEGPHVHLQPRRAHMYICSPGGPTCTFAAVYCTLHTVCYKLHTAQCNAHCTLQCTLHTMYCTLHTLYCTLRTAHCVLHTAHCTLCVVCSTQGVVCSV